MSQPSAHLARDSAAQRASTRQFAATRLLLGQLILLLLGIELSMRIRGGNLLRSEPVLEDGGIGSGNNSAIYQNEADGRFFLQPLDELSDHHPIFCNTEPGARPAVRFG